jgi:biotin carboxyl carrier protein
VKYYVSVNGSEHEVELSEVHGELRVAFDGRPLVVRYEEVDRLGQVALYVGDPHRSDEGGAKAYAVSIEGGASQAQVTVAGHLYQIALEDERERAAHDAERTRTKGGGDLKSIMPGVVIKLLVAEGATVEKDQPLLILEAMKMQNEIGAPAAGRVTAVHVREGQAVSSGAKLLTLTAAE